MKHITISKWERHQHYKDRRPTWIKLEIEIIDEFDADGNPKKFHTISDQAKLTFVCLLCLRANFNEKIPFKSEKWLAEKLGINKVDLQPLVNAGYIEIHDDTVSEPYQDDTEVVQGCAKKHTPEREKEREKDICATDTVPYQKSNNGFSKAFLSFYDFYPIKKSKHAAWKAWIKNKPDLETCIKAIEAQIHEKQKLKERGQFCPDWKHPATWLNQHCWEDEIVTTSGSDDHKQNIARITILKQGFNILQDDGHEAFEIFARDNQFTKEEKDGILEAQQ